MAMSLGMAAIVTVTFADGTSYSGSMINSKLTYGLDRRLEMDCYFFVAQIAKIDLDKPSSAPADPPVKSKSVAPKAGSVLVLRCRLCVHWLILPCAYAKYPLLAVLVNNRR